MSLVNKCDRCGVVFDYANEFDQVFRSVDHYAAVIRSRYSFDKNVDLCFECTKALNKFMTECEEKKDG